jgi:hypothetical protein
MRSSFWGKPGFAAQDVDTAFSINELRDFDRAAVEIELVGVVAGEDG